MADHIALKYLLSFGTRQTDDGMYTFNRMLSWFKFDILLWNGNNSLRVQVTGFLWFIVIALFSYRQYLAIKGVDKLF